MLTLKKKDGKTLPKVILQWTEFYATENSVIIKRKKQKMTGLNLVYITYFPKKPFWRT